jgi:ubiquinone/menaquinone biosynthesis C-methylase UbiE
MIANRYTHQLREKNQLILDLTPGNYVLRIELSLELKRSLRNKKAKVLEIGCGEGDLTAYLLKNNQSIIIDCLDISKEMLQSAQRKLASYRGRTRFVQQDVLEYFNSTNQEYALITEAWTLHNFPWKNKIHVLEKMYAHLAPQGKILLMDKIYPDNAVLRKQMLQEQLVRYRYLENNLRKEICDHEQQDFLATYRMDETRTIQLLKKIGYRKIAILSRVTRDVVLTAEK